MNPNLTPEQQKNEAEAQRKRFGLEPVVSANELVNPTPTVTPPTPIVNTNDGSRTRNLIDNTTANTQQFITSQSENAQRRDELANLLGEQEFDAAGQRQKLSDQFGVAPNLARLQDIQTQLAQANTQSGLTKVGIAGAAGQTLSQGQRELTQEDRENAVRNAGLAAEASVLQGNIETASTLINNAMQDFYSDRTLKNQNMINQLEYFSGLADEETSQLLKQEQRKYEEDQRQIIRAESAVDAAVSSGFASPEELKQITSLAGNPEAQTALAQKIVARGAADAMFMDRAFKQASIANIYDQMAARTQSNNQKLIELAEKQSLTEKEEREKKTLASEKALQIKSLAEKLRDHPALSTAIGPVSSKIGGFSTLAGASGQRAEVLALIDQLSGSLTLENTKYLKGAMSDKDLDLLAGAASRLKATGVGEPAYETAINEVIDVATRTINQNGLTTEQATFFGYVDSEEAQLLNDMWGNTEEINSTFDAAKYFNE